MAQPALNVVISARDLGAGAAIRGIDNDLGGLAKTAAAAAVGVTAAFAGIGVAAVKGAANLQQAVANISTIKPSIDTKAVAASLNAMSADVGRSSTELADSLYNVFSSVSVSQEEALRLTETFARGAIGAQTDAATFGTSIMGVMNAYGLAASDAAHISDVFFNTINSGVVTGQELAMSLGPVTAAARAAGVSLNELGAMIAGVTREGGPAEQNINNLNNLLQKITTNEAQNEIRDLGVATTDAAGNFRPILDVLGDLKPKLDVMTESARASAIQKIFPDMQARQGAQVILSQLAFVNEALETNRIATGASAAAFTTMTNTVSSQVGILKATVLAELTSLGLQALPILQPWLVRLNEELPRAFEAARNAASQLGQVLSGEISIGDVVTAIGHGLESLADDVQSQIQNAATAIGTRLSSALAAAQAVKLPALDLEAARQTAVAAAAIVAAAFGNALALAQAVALPALEDAKAAGVRAGELVVSGMAEAIAKAPPIAIPGFAGGGDTAGAQAAIAGGLTNNTEQLEQFTNIAGGLLTIMVTLGPATRVLASGLALLRPIVASITLALGAAGLTLVLGGLAIAAVGLKLAWDKNLGGIQDVARDAAAGAKTELDKLPGTLKSVAAQFAPDIRELSVSLEKLGPIAKAQLAPLSRSFEGLSSAIAPLLPSVRDLVRLITEQLVGGIKGNIGTLTSFANVLSVAIPIAVGIVTTVIDALAAAIRGITALVKAVVSTVDAVLRGDWVAAWQGGQDVLTAAKATMTGIVQAIANGIGGTITRLIDQFIPNWRGAWEMAAAIVFGVGESISRAVGGIRDALTALVSGAGQILERLIAGDFTGAWERAQALATVGLANVGAAVGDGMTSVAVTIAAAASQIDDVWAEGWREIGDTTWGGVATFSAGADGMVGAVDDMIGRIRQRFQNDLPSALNVGTTMGAVRAEMEAQTAAIAETVTTTMGGVLAGMAPETEAAVASAARAGTEAARAAIPAAEEAAKALAEAVTEPLSDVERFYESVGRDAITNLAAWLNSGALSVEQASKDINRYLSKLPDAVVEQLRVFDNFTIDLASIAPEWATVIGPMVEAINRMPAETRAALDLTIPEWQRWADALRTTISEAASQIASFTGSVGETAIANLTGWLAGGVFSVDTASKEITSLLGRIPDSVLDQIKVFEDFSISLQNLAPEWQVLLQPFIDAVNNMDQETREALELNSIPAWRRYADSVEEEARRAAAAAASIPLPRSLGLPFNVAMAPEHVAANAEAARAAAENIAVSTAELQIRTHREMLERIEADLAASLARKDQLQAAYRDADSEAERISLTRQLAESATHLKELTQRQNYYHQAIARSEADLDREREAARVRQADMVRAMYGQIEAQTFVHKDRMAELTRRMGEEGARNFLLMGAGVDQVTNAVSRLLGVLGDVPGSVQISGQWGGVGIGGTMGQQGDITRRALGGPVWAGQPALVGERGIELFVPRRDGAIIPNDQLRGMQGGDTTIVNNNYGPQYHVSAGDGSGMDSLNELSRLGV